MFCLYVCLKVLILEKGNHEAVNAINNLNEYLSNSSTIGVTMYTEYVEGSSSHLKEFLENCKYSSSSVFATIAFVLN